MNCVCVCACVCLREREEGILVCLVSLRNLFLIGAQPITVTGGAGSKFPVSNEGVWLSVM